jgi:ferric-dicitrate binding protein FerR (iron transport regulator)
VEKKLFFKLLKKYQTGKATEQEKEVLFAYYNLFEAEFDHVSEMSEAEKSQLETLMHDEIAKGMKGEARSKVTMMRWYQNRNLQIAASILLLIGLGTYVGLRSFREQPLIVYKNGASNIKPGANTATLTLANGNTVALNNAASGTIARQGGIAVVQNKAGLITYDIRNLTQNGRSEDTSTNLIRTPRGGQYAVILSDGSKVVLNSGSALRFPVRFHGKIRTVNLSGEAYFEVAHNAQMPFIVASDEQKVEVLGTHFDIQDYRDDDHIRTTLLQGSIRISNRSHTAVLTPGMQAEQSRQAAGADFKLQSQSDPEESVAWMNGYLHFENADLKEVMTQLSRWYNFDVVYQGNVGNQRYSGDIYKKLNIDEALQVLKQFQVHFTVEDKKIIVSP